MPRLNQPEGDRAADVARRADRGHARWSTAWRERRVLVNVLLLLGATRLALLVVPFRRLAQFLGPTDSESPLDVSGGVLAEASRVAWAVRVVSGRTPWASTCFPQALTAMALLRRRGIATTLYLGAAIRPDRDGMEAHAWLRCGPLYVTGGPGHLRYGIVARFSGTPSRIDDRGSRSLDAEP